MILWSSPFHLRWHFCTVRSRFPRHPLFFPQVSQEVLVGRMSSSPWGAEGFWTFQTRFEVQSDEKSRVEALFFFVWKWKMSRLETKHLNSSSRAPFSTEPWIRMFFFFKEEEYVVTSWNLGNEASGSHDDIQKSYPFTGLVGLDGATWCVSWGWWRHKYAKLLQIGLNGVYTIVKYVSMYIISFVSYIKMPSLKLS